MNNNPMKDNFPYNLDSKTLKSHSDTDNISLLKTTCQTDNLKVVIRIRPALPREMENDIPFRSIALISNENKSCSLVEYLGAELNESERQREWMENPNLFQIHRFTFDHAFDMDSSQQEVYEVTAKPAVLSILEGYNSTIFAYGQTGTGKTYTMEGFTYNSTDTQRGIIPRSIEEIFNHIESFSSPDTKFMVRASYLQIYNESISDLLKPEKISLQIREDKKKGVFVEGLSEWAVRNPADIYTLLQRGAASRATASTKMNDVSSRSHAVFMIIVEQLTILESGNDGSITQIKVGKLNLVDLAGSERIRVTGATGRQLEESKKINKSLSALGNVIYALTDNKGRTHIPYRDSKLTRLLEDSLGGNCKTTMMAMISPCHDSFNESLSTLHFSKRAKNIKNRPIINEDVDHRALIRQYEVELKKLRNELEEKNRLIHTNELVIQLEEERKRAEEDKQAAIYAFEQASKQYLQEREEKKRLEMKIQMMNSQVIVGGHKIEDTPQFRSALEERQTFLLKEFDQKLQEFDKEKQQIEEDKVQVEHYKKFLQKLRDIMIALTTRLNERNETIDQLQDEIEAYEKIIRNLEDDIDIKIHRINVLEDAMKKGNVEIPPNTMPQIEKEKNYSRRAIDKLYIPYDYDRGDRGLENAPITMLNADEKIRELNGIIKEQDKELNIMKIVVHKFMNNQNEKINLNEMYSKYEQEYESVNKIRELEEYRYKLLKELDEKDEIINFSKQENEELNEQIDFLDKNFEILNNEFTKINATHEDTIKNLDNLYIKLNSFEQIASQASNFPNNNSSVSTFQQNIKFVKSEAAQILENLKRKNNSLKNNNLRNSNQILNNNNNIITSNHNNSINSNNNNNNLLLNPNSINENNLIGINQNNSNSFYSNNLNSNLTLTLNNEENSIVNMDNNQNKIRDTNNLITQINNNYNNFKEKRNKSLKKFNVTNNDPSLLNFKSNSLNKSAAQLNINISSENLKNTNNLLKAYKFENIANLKNTPNANISNNSANPVLQNSLMYNQSSNIKSYPNSGANSNNTSFIYQNSNLNLNNLLNVNNNNNNNNAVAINNPNSIPHNSYNGILAHNTNFSPSPGMRNVTDLKKSFNSPPYDLKAKQGNINIVNNQTTNNLINNNNINNTNIFLNNANNNPNSISTANNYNLSKEKEKLFANSNYNTYNINSNRIPGNTITNLGNTSNKNNNNNISEINNSGNPLLIPKGNNISQLNNNNSNNGYNNNNNYSNRNPNNPINNFNSPNYTNNSTSNSNMNSNASKGNNRPENLISMNSNSKTQEQQINYNNNNYNNNNSGKLNNPNNYYLNQMNYSELNNSVRLQKGSRENSLQENNFNISSPNQSDKNNNYANNSNKNNNNNSGYNYNFNNNLNISNQKRNLNNNNINNNYNTDINYAQNDKNYNNSEVNEYTLGCTNDDNVPGASQYQNSNMDNNFNKQFGNNNLSLTNRSNADNNINSSNNFNNKPRPLRNKSESFVNKFINANK